MKRAVIIFTRVPEPGKTKTRMMPHLSPVQCARLHTCFLKDIVMECRNGGADVFVSYTPEEGWKTLKKHSGRGKGMDSADRKASWRADVWSYERGAGSEI